MSTLADRLRGVIREHGERRAEREASQEAIARSAGHGSGEEERGLEADRSGTTEPIRAAGTPVDRATLEQLASSELGASLRRYDQSRCFTIDTRWPADSRHGSSTIGSIADGLRDAERGVALVAGTPIGVPLLFFDLETTGLNGGAGTYAFLVGCGWFDEDDGFLTRQFLLLRPADERALLTAVADEASRAAGLVSFNGKSFDRPLIDTRYAYHRLNWEGAGLPHLDMLHVARRFWKRTAAHASELLDTGCSLTALEQQVLGHHRRGDMPGFEAPRRYFQFIRSGDVRQLAPVLEHNRLDLLSLAALTARAAWLARSGPDEAQDVREALALGWLYARSGAEQRARQAYERAVDLSCGSPALQVESLRVLAASLRRAHLHSDAARCWRRILGLRSCPAHVVREASEALAIHHEHRVRDLTSARRFALRTLEPGSRPARYEAGRHRLSRIDRKLARFTSDPSRLQFSDPLE